MKKPAIIFAVGLLARLAMIMLQPILFGGDTILRLVNHDRIVISYQLPALQTLIHFLSMVTLDPLVARVVMSLIGSLVGVGFYYLASHFVDETHAFWAALLCAVHPFLLGLSTVPYQEPLMLAALFFAFHFLLSERIWESSLALGIACLTRYEAWAACPVFAVEYMVRRRIAPSAALRAIGLFGWAPLAWLIYNGGLSAQGSFVLETHLTLARLVRYVYLGWITVKFTPLPVVLVGLFGLWYGVRTRLSWPLLRAPAAFVALFLIAILLSAHGVDPDPEKFVTSREAYIPMSAVLLLAAIGLSRMPRGRQAVVMVSIFWGLVGSYFFLRGETAKPELRLSYSLARFVDSDGGARGNVLVLARHTPRPQIQYYLDRAFQAGGDQALEAAKSELERVRLEPIDFLRVLTHAREGRKRLIGIPALRFWRSPAPARVFPDPRQFNRLIVWSDYQPADETEHTYVKALLPEYFEFRSFSEDALKATIYKRTTGR